MTTRALNSRRRRLEVVTVSGRQFRRDEGGGGPTLSIALNVTPLRDEAHRAGGNLSRKSLPSCARGRRGAQSR